MTKIHGIEDLHVWKSARLLARHIDELIKTGKLNRNQPLETQLRRSSISVVSNIAEGFGRGGNREFINFLSMARGSLNELLSQVILAYDAGSCPDHLYKTIRGTIEETGKLIGGMTRYLKKTEYSGSKFNQQ